MQRNKRVIFLIIFTVFSQLFAEVSNTNLQTVKIDFEHLPAIEKLSSKDILFKEYSSIVESNYKLVSAGKMPESMFFVYKNTENFTLQGLSSRCNIPYDTIATLNRIETSTENISNETLILPTVPGLFVCVQKGKSSIEILLQENHNTQELPEKSYIVELNDNQFFFLQNKRFTPTERAFFLDSALLLPLPQDSFWVSSEFGKRKNPFSGQMKNHNGIDLAAAEGTPVYAIKDGSVFGVILNDSEFGNYIILSHDQGKLSSVYAHLSKVCVDQYDSIKKGDIIGYVGQTGMATGHHLHFEIKQGGKAQDPRLKLNLN